MLKWLGGGSFMPELLIPVGDFESLEYAIANGADAVYLGVKKFNARSYAKNFSLDEMRGVVRLCHLYGVKIYVTMNTLIKDQEVEEFLETVSFLHQIGVDALIMQDFGMISVVLDTFPKLEVHASTQANVSTKEAISLYHNMGVRRVVLPREMSLEEIEAIDLPIEKEVFIHGALCMSYSGCCLMSSMIGSRSANQGECTGCCRLPYAFYRNDKKLKEGYLLSTKELNTSSRISELVKSGITSFKVEGRMKSAFYVGFITRFYRRLLDGREFSYEEELDKLRILFNREFTLGHLFHEDIRNSFSPNHLGLKIGQVLEISPKYIKIKLDYPLYQEDGLRFQQSKLGFVANFIYNCSFELISSAQAGEVIFLDNKIGLTKKDVVYKTTSKKLSADILKLDQKKIPVSLSLKARVGEPLILIISDSENHVSVSSSIVERALTSPMTEESIKRQITKLGSTPFISRNVNIEMDQDTFISIKELNALRREGISKLQKLREERKKPYIRNEVSFPILTDFIPRATTSVSVETEEQLKAVESLAVSTIYLPSSDSFLPDSSKYVETEAFGKVLSSSCLRKFYRKPLADDISDYTFNVTNIYTVYYLLKLGYKRVTLSVELSNEEIIFLFTRFREVFHFTPNLEVIVYDRVAVMNIYGNVFDMKQDHATYYLKDQKERIFPVSYKNGFTTIYHYEVVFREIDQLSLLPICLRFTFFDEDATKIRQLVNS